MKVLFLTNIPSPYRVDFFNELGKMCDLTVTFEGKNATDRDVNWKADKIENFTAVFMKGKRVRSDAFICMEILTALRQKWDAIILGGYSTPTLVMAIEFLRTHKIEFYLEVDGGLISKESKLKYYIKKHFIGSASAWLSTGKLSDQYLEYYGASKDQIHRYPFSSVFKDEIVDIRDISEEKKIYLRRKLNMYEEKIVLTVGQFIHRKGFDLLLRAAAEFDENVGFYFVGSKVTEEYLELQKQHNLKNVHFIEFVIKDELKKYYQAADIFAFPTREDIWGLVINEAMANGLPIITTDKCVAGIELVKNEYNGYIIETENIQQLVQRISDLLENNRTQKFGIRSIDMIRDHTIENMAKVHMEILQNNERK